MLQKTLHSYRANLDAQKARIQLYQHLLKTPGYELPALIEEHNSSNNKLGEFISNLGKIKEEIDTCIAPGQNNIIN
jgi:hypothetical protein